MVRIKSHGGDFCPHSLLINLLIVRFRGQAGFVFAVRGGQKLLPCVVLAFIVGTFVEDV